MPPQARRDAVSSPLPRPTGLGCGRRAALAWPGTAPTTRRRIRIKPLAALARQLDAEVGEHADEDSHHGEAGVDQPLVAALADALDERATEQDHHGGDQPDADHERGREDDQPLPEGLGGEHTETVAR